ncbi:hypothetical protein GCK72_019248 [Caenorhabditis remanei]|uniref:Uncharacterized protein n=1 Tax=Caenorhabditis remanei TaxID=31234 RepID=A0A6A5GDE4_CAERE|nr:hypothetical protein GCK72_019248 [Caenorhabditis remanei]KAF1752693.1 hypothetical protein GCK72_019248 [Caenorhabditis remanei]
MTINGTPVKAPLTSEVVHGESTDDLLRQIANLKWKLAEKEVEAKDRRINELNLALKETDKTHMERFQFIEQETERRVQLIEEVCEQKIKDLMMKSQYSERDNGMQNESQYDIRDGSVSPQPTNDFDTISCANAFGAMSDKLHESEQRVIYLQNCLHTQIKWIEKLFSDNARLVPNMLIHNQGCLPKRVQMKLQYIMGYIKEEDEASWVQPPTEVRMMTMNQRMNDDVDNLQWRLRDSKF